jgi:hypothetical protein
MLRLRRPFERELGRDPWFSSLFKRLNEAPHEARGPFQLEPQAAAQRQVIFGTVPQASH